MCSPLLIVCGVVASVVPTTAGLTAPLYFGHIADYDQSPDIFVVPVTIGNPGRCFIRVLLNAGGGKPYKPLF